MPAHPALERLRQLCLALPETSEATAWGHPNFRAGSRTFVAWEDVGGRPTIAFRMAPEDADWHVREAGFLPTPYGRGRWASLPVEARMNWKQIERLVEASYRQVASKRMVAKLEHRSQRGSC